MVWSFSPTFLVPICYTWGKYDAYILSFITSLISPNILSIFSYILLIFGSLALNHYNPLSLQNMTIRKVGFRDAYSIFNFDSEVIISKVSIACPICLVCSSPCFSQSLHELWAIVVDRASLLVINLFNKILWDVNWVFATFKSPNFELSLKMAKACTWFKKYLTIIFPFFMCHLAK